MSELQLRQSRAEKIRVLAPGELLCFAEPIYEPSSSHWKGPWLCACRDIPVAVGALSRRVPVNHDFLVCDRAGLDMALGAVNVGVATGQGEVSFSVVIKGGGHPAQRIVAISAVRPIVLGQELFVVRVGVTRFALRWRALKTRSRRGNQLVAVRARDRSMGAQ